MEPLEPIPGKPPRQVVIDRQRKLFASLDIEELLLEFVSFLISDRSFWATQSLDLNRSLI